MMPTADKPFAPYPGSDHPAAAINAGAIKGTTPAERRAALEAQKRYMDERFGRDRPMGRKSAE